MLRKMLNLLRHPIDKKEEDSERTETENETLFVQNEERGTSNGKERARVGSK